MKKFLPISCLFALSFPVQASLIDIFKDEEGRTKWQHVANFSSSVLILLLLVTVVFLLIAHRRAKKSNAELNEIRKFLEQRVQERTANLRAANIALEGEIKKHMETAFQLRVSEAYIKSILDSMPIMLIGLNSKMEIIQWNRWAETTTGMDSDIALGKNLWDAYPAISLAPQQVEEVLKQGKNLTIKHTQRGQYYFDITLYAVKDQKETGVVILVDDITKRMKAENKLVQRDKISAMGELASAMAHDISSPLQTILTTLGVVRQQLAEKFHQDELNGLTNILTPMLTNAEDSGKQASAIIQNLLEFSRNHDDTSQPTNITEVVNHSLDIAASLLSHPSGFRFSDIKIVRQYEKVAKIPLIVSEIQQVFLSLFRHAFHYLSERMGASGFVPEIQVDINELYDAIWVKIHHNGKGLSAEEQLEIFEPYFSNMSEGTTCPIEHRLSFSHFIITEHHAGQMAVTSDLELGTTFHIQFQVTK
ncbi:MAG: PAS domain S-box protein [Cellvibrionaceae bacterium]|nr:PAS domain S-box protein [Cellvibrionaceae bacterium]